MSIKVGDILNLLETLAPSFIAEPNDSNGLQIGSNTSDIRGILLTIDLTSKVLKYAIENNYNLIISHHPLIYQPLKRIEKETYIGKIIYQAISNDLNIISWHTPFDKVSWGVSSALVRELGWKYEEFILTERGEFGLGRVVKFESYVKLHSLAKEIAEKLKTWVMIVGDPSSEIDKLGVCGGSGGHLKKTLHSKGITTLLTSDVKYHLARESEEEGFNFLIIDHGIGESLFLKELKIKIEEFLRDRDPLIPVDTFYHESPYKIIFKGD